jgi:hypothetical protein
LEQPVPSGFLRLSKCIQRVLAYLKPDAERNLENAQSECEAFAAWKVPAEGRNLLLYETSEMARSRELATTRLQAMETEFQSAHDQAKRYLRQALGDGQILAFRLRYRDGERLPIPAPRWWTDLGEHALTTGEWTRRPERADPSQGLVIIREVDLEELLNPSECRLPAHDATIAADPTRLPSLGTTEPSAGSTVAPRPGGRPRREDWKLFNQRVVQIAWEDGGNLTRTEFRRMMKSWAAENMSEPIPDDRTIERHLDELVPVGLLPH